MNEVPDNADKVPDNADDGSDGEVSGTSEHAPAPSKESLEAEKLRKEIDELGRPFYRRHQFWINFGTLSLAFVATLVAAFGWLLERQALNNELRHQQLAAERARLDRDVAEFEILKSERQLADITAQQELAIQERDAAQQAAADARAEARKFSELISTLPRSPMVCSTP